MTTPFDFRNLATYTTYYDDDPVQSVPKPAPAAGQPRQTTVNGRVSTYTANALNQYTQRTVPGAVDVLGDAATDAVVTVMGTAATRQGGLFYRAVPVTNTAYPVSQGMITVASKNGGSVSDLGRAYVPKTPEAYTYDLDGNLTSDGRWTYTWDAENRLTAMETLASVPAAARKKLAFDYDSMGRRIRKRVWNWNTSAGT
jgi:YD repeat-containing protein